MAALIRSRQAASAGGREYTPPEYFRILNARGLCTALHRTEAPQCCKEAALVFHVHNQLGQSPGLNRQIGHGLLGFIHGFRRLMGNLCGIIN